MQSTVIFDSDCALCTRVRNTVEALDWFGTLRWLSQTDPEAARYGIPTAELENSVFLITSAGHTHGWRAVKRIVARLPLTYVVGAAAVRKSPWAALAIAAVFSPAFNPVGQRAYDWVAQNRYRLPGSTCPTPDLG